MVHYNSITRNSMYSGTTVLLYQVPSTAAHVARDAGQGGELVARRDGLRLRELVQQRRFTHAREADHRHAPVSAPRDVETL